jgi:type IV pilus assembly protein PilP
MRSTSRFSSLLRYTGIAIILVGLFAAFGYTQDPPPQTVKKFAIPKPPPQKAPASEPAAEKKAAKPTPQKAAPAPAPKKASAPAPAPKTEPAPSAQADPKTQEASPAGEEAGEELSVEGLLATFSYDPTDKVDPFAPLFSDQPAVKEEEQEGEAKEGEKKQKKKKRIPRTPLEKVDLSQLKLVAIVRAESGNRALVQDASGKGYVLNLGTYIGINSGIVKEIQKDKVIVEEEVEDIYGKESLREREMVLQKPLGEL